MQLMIKKEVFLLVIALFLLSVPFTFAEEDYANIFTKKQPEYNSTNFNFSYSPNEDLKFNFDIENLFKNSYGTRLRNDVIYPGNSTRNIKAGLTYKF